MTEPAAVFAADERLFLTYDSFVEAIQEVGGSIHQVNGAPVTLEETKGGSLERNLRALIARGKRTGVILDSFQERRDFQKELDYLAKLLERLHASPEDVSLEAFQPQSLASISVPVFPFDDALEQIEKTPAPAREDLERYLVDKARAVKLRFDDGLVEEISMQLSGDPEAWPLLWCCLGNLFARLSKEGLGNKLRRPKGSASFDCKSFAAEVAKTAYQDCPVKERSSFKAVLIQFGLSAGGRESLPAGLSISRIKTVAGANASTVITRLGDYRLAWLSEALGGEPRYRLVHRSLQERWEELQAWVQAQREQRSKRKAVAWILTAASLLVVAVGAGTYGYLKGEAAADVAAREVAIRSLDLLALNSDLALATAMEAVCRNKTTELAWESVARALDSRREIYRFYPPAADRQRVVAGFTGETAKVITATSEGRMKVWNAQGGTDPVPLPDKLVSVKHIAFSANAPRVAVAGQNAEGVWKVHLLSLGNGEAIGASVVSSDEISALASSSDGTRLATGTTRGTVQLYSDAGSPIGEPVSVGRSVRMLSFNSDGSLLVANTTDDKGLQGKASVWAVRSAKLGRVAEVSGAAQEQSLAVGLTSDGTQLVTIGQEFGEGIKVQVIDLQKLTSETTTIPNLSVQSAVLDAEGGQVLLVGLDGTIRVWDWKQRVEALVIPSSADFWGGTGVFSHSGHQIAVTTADSTIRVSSLTKTGVSSGGEPIRSVAFNPVDNRRIATGTIKGTVYLWELGKDEPTRTLRVRQPEGPDSYGSSSVNSVSYSKDGTRIAASYDDGKVRVWDVNRGQLEGQPLPASRGEVAAACASFSSDGKRLVTTSTDGYVGVWEGESPKWLSDQVGPATRPDAPACAAFSEDGDHVIVALRNGRTHNWAWRTNQKAGPDAVAGDGRNAFDLDKATFSPNGKKIAGQSAKPGSDVLLLDAESGALLGQLPGARRVANFTRDGTRVATIDFDSVVSVWDTNSYRRIARLGTNQTLAALSSDGVNVLAVRERAWYIDPCRACGDLADVAYKGALEKEAQLALRGILDNPMYEGQFSCMREQKSRRQ